MMAIQSAARILFATVIDQPTMPVTIMPIRQFRRNVLRSFVVM